MSRYTVYKYPLADIDVTINMPFGAEVLHLNVQKIEHMWVGHLWVRVQTDLPVEPRVFHSRGTGHEIDPAWHYVGTFMPPETGLVIHVFEEPPRRDA